MNASLPPTFVITYPYSVFTQLNITLVRLNGATSLRDNKWADLIAQWISSSPLIRTSFSEAMEHTPFNEVHESKVPAIRAHAQARVPAPYLLGLLLELGYPGPASLWCLGKLHAGKRLHRLQWATLPTTHFHTGPIDAAWQSWTAPLASTALLKFADAPASGRCWRLRWWAQHVQSRRALCQSVDWALPLTFVVRGDGYLCADGGWSQL